MQTRHLIDLARRATEPGPAAADAVLLGRFADHRDPAAFEALVRRHGSMVWAVCRQTLHNPADAEDAFQATFLALVRSARRVRGAAALPAWLHRVAVRAAVNLRRGAARRQRRERAAAAGEADRPVPDAAWEGFLAAVHEEVARLPEGQRAAFVLCDLEGVPQPAAAARLGWKPGTLTGRLARARRTLLDRLARRGVSPAAVGVAAAAAVDVPAGAAERVLDWAGGSPAPAGVLKLATEVMSVTNRVKLWVAAGTAACGVVLAGIGTVRPPAADAQAPAAQVPLPEPGGTVGGARVRPPGTPHAVAAPVDPFAAPAAPPAAPAAPTARAAWEYDYADVPASPAAFQDLLAMRGRERWEYAGVVDPALFTRSRPEKALIVFKRPSGPAPAPVVVTGPGTLHVEPAQPPRPVAPTPPRGAAPASAPQAADPDTAVQLAEIAVKRATVEMASAKDRYASIRDAVVRGQRSKSDLADAQFAVELAEVDFQEAQVRLAAAKKVADAAAARKTINLPTSP